MTPRDRFMMATTAHHALGDISRDEPSLVVITGQIGDQWIGEWVTGVGYINVRFPKATTRELTTAEHVQYNGRWVQAGSGMWQINLDPCCDLHSRTCEAPSELCCEGCAEAAHIGLTPHADGSRCVLAEAQP